MEQSADRKRTLPGRAIFPALIVLTVIFGMIGCSGNSVTPREGSISGKITDISGKPVEDALVSWAYDRTRWCLTDENGAYYIQGIGFGDQDFLVEAFGYRTATFKASIYSGQNTAAAETKVEAKSFDYLEIKVDEFSATHAVISWKTTDYTNGLVEYGETDALGRVVREEAGVYSTTHSVKITGLTAAKTYYFKVIANREGRAAETSTLQTLNTLSTIEDKTAPTPPAGVEAALTGTPGQLAVFWAASSDTDLKGYRVYRSELANGVFSVISNVMIARGQEKFTDYTVTAGKKYFYRVTAIDQAGNESGFNNMASMLVPGNIATEIRWTRANSPYLVAGDIMVSETGKLYIDSGVEVLMAETDGLRSGNPELIEFNVSGAIIASAGNGLPVVFASARVNPDKGMWQGLALSNTEDSGNTLINVNISDAVYGLHIDKSTGQFSEIGITNCTTGVVCENTTGLSIFKATTRRCSTGMELKSNNSLLINGCSLVHPTTGINSQSNAGLKITACNFLEYTETGLMSNESGGIIEFIDNLFVSPVGTGLKIMQQSVLVEYNTFDTPSAIQINSGNSNLRKNLIMADRSIFGSGNKGIEYLAATLPLIKFGPNNMQGFASDTAYVGCEATADSKTDDVLLMKELSGGIYDYRLRQAYPDLSDPWGIRREAIPFEG
jgi:hypothetical protein